MTLAYDPSARTLAVSYAVAMTGDRWFIPQNNNDTTANQLAACNALVGQGADDTDVGSEVVAE